MFQKFNKIKFIIAVCAVILPLGLNTFAQSDWLDMKPLPSWNERKRAILETKKISPAELKRCAVVVRQPTLPQDFLLTKMGWTLVGAAHVFGKTTIITTAEAFDGMCRPLKFENYVFVGNRVAGTPSPGQMDSRTDGYLTDIKMPTEKSITAEFARYRESDALCCPYKIEAVTYTIKPDGANFLLVPEGKFETSVSNKNEENQPSEANMSKGADALKNAVWRWESSENLKGKVTLDKPENYQIQFMPDGKLGVKADCNTGGGSYKTDARKISIERIFTTKAFCGEKSFDTRFLQGLESARTFRIEGNSLFIEGADENGTMKFYRVSKQN